MPTIGNFGCVLLWPPDCRPGPHYSWGRAEVEAERCTAPFRAIIKNSRSASSRTSAVSASLGVGPQNRMALEFLPIPPPWRQTRNKRSGHKLAVADFLSDHTLEETGDEARLFSAIWWAFLVPFHRTLEARGNTSFAAWGLMVQTTKR